MSREEYLKKLNEAFCDFKFFPDDHHYEYKGERVGISVTRLIEEYCNEFDSDRISKMVADKRGVSQQEVLDEWKYKNEFACNKGTNGHNFAQSLWNGETYSELPFDGSEAFKTANKRIYKQAKNFHNDYCDRLGHLADEFVAGSVEYDVCSAIDHLFINKVTGGLVLVDYKTNKELSGYNKRPYKKPMKPPLQNINDDTIHHYFIQLSIYKYFIEKYAGLEVSEMFIVYFSENIDDYKIIDIPYLKKEVEEILEWRKWE